MTSWTLPFFQIITSITEYFLICQAWLMFKAAMDAGLPFLTNYFFSPMYSIRTLVLEHFICVKLFFHPPCFLGGLGQLLCPLKHGTSFSLQQLMPKNWSLQKKYMKYFVINNVYEHDIISFRMTGEKWMWLLSAPLRYTPSAQIIIRLYFFSPLQNFLEKNEESTIFYCLLITCIHIDLSVEKVTYIFVSFYLVKW